MNPSLHQLHAFVRVYRQRSVAAAAREMHLTSSAVSLLIRQLEDTWNTRLFDRSTRSLHPTTAAEEAIVLAERLLVDAEQLNTSMRAVAKLAQGRVRFAITSSLAFTVLPAILQRFSREYPGIEVVILDVGPDRLVPIVLSGEAEFSLGVATVNSSKRADINLTTLFTDRLCVICLKGSPLASYKVIEWAQLASHPTISLRIGSDLRAVINEAMARANRKFEPTYEVSLFTTSLAMTARGLGASILPSHLLPMFDRPSLVAVPLAAPVVKRTIAVITRSGRSLSPAAQRFVEVTQSAISQAA
ncbi:MAG: LysR family transcriptional regulator [Burkholderiales bacterium]|nr:LysR family transcriptional regulator [Burkholderiales bacterium]